MFFAIRSAHICRCAERLPEYLVSDIPTVYAAAQLVNPAVDPDAFFRAVVRLGCEAVRRNNERHVPIRTAELPHARHAMDEAACRKATEAAVDGVPGLRPSRI